jgi:hypothetical protein
MARKKAGKLTDKQLAKRLFSPAVRKQLKKALEALDVETPEGKRKKR